MLHNIILHTITTNNIINSFKGIIKHSLTLIITNKTIITNKNFLIIIIIAIFKKL